MIRLFRIFVPTGVLALVLADTLIVLGCFLGAAFVFLEVDLDLFLLYEGGLLRLAITIFSLIFSAYLQDLYSSANSRSRAFLLNSLVTTIATTLILQGVVSYFSNTLRTPVRIMLPGSLAAIAALFGWRLLYNKVVWSIAAQRILLVGGSPLLEEICLDSARRREMGLTIIGYVDDGYPGNGPRGAETIGPVSQLREIVETVKPDRIVVGFKERRALMPVETLLDLRCAGHAIEEVSTFYEKVCRRISSRNLFPSQLIFSSEFASRQNWITTVFDITAALACLVLALPAMLVIAAAIKLDSRGPVLFKQRRVGKDGVYFMLYKFRSMCLDAEKETGAVWSTAEDPRVTRVGRIIRTLRLDELPQCFNVLRGDMSIVGPRPERPEFVAVLAERIPFYRQRHAVKPGITGWAQINYRYGENFEDAVRKLEYDLYYIKYMSQSLNNYIIFATAKTMLLGRGAR